MEECEGQFVGCVRHESCCPGLAVEVISPTLHRECFCLYCFPVSKYFCFAHPVMQSMPTVMGEQ